MDGPVADCAGDLRTTRTATSSHHLQTMDRYTTLAAEQMHGAAAAPALDLAVHPPAAFLRNYVLRRGFRDGAPGLVISAMNARYVLLKFAKLCAHAAAIRPPHRHRADLARAARTQCLLTVRGLRAAGPPGGAGRASARASCAGARREGLDLVPLAPRNEIDLAAAWQLARIVRQSQPRGRPRARPARGGASRRWRWRSARPRRGRSSWRRAASTSTCRRNAFSRWKYRQVDGFIAPRARSRHPGPRRHRCRDASRWCTTASTSSTLSKRPRDRSARRVLAAARRARRRQRRRAGGAQGPAPPGRRDAAAWCARSPTRTS